MRVSDLEDYMPPATPTEVALPTGIERMVVTTADGRVFDLGRPTSRGFRARVWLYRLRRRSELRHG